MTTSRVVIIADDLTGALDAAAPFARHGCSARVVALPSASDAAFAQAMSGAQVLCVNTDTRHCDAHSAAAAVRRAVQRCASGAEVLFKKIDSTLRGNVAAETIAALQASGRRAAILAPAFPAQGRVMRDGVVYVHGQALEQTEFVRDALSPAPRAPLAQVLREAAPGWAVANANPSELAARLAREATRLWVVDAQTQPELEQIAAAAAVKPEAYLLVGSAGLSSALVGTAARAPRAALAWHGGLTLFVVGSRSQRSRAQAAALRAEPATVCLEAPDGELSAAQLERVLRPASPRGSVLILATQRSGGATDADIVAQRLAQSCAQALAQADVSTIVASGGDTAKAILEQLNVPVVEVLDELLPGLALARFESNKKQYCFITKAGGFGREDTFVSIGRVAGAG